MKIMKKIMFWAVFLVVISILTVFIVSSSYLTCLSESIAPQTSLHNIAFSIAAGSSIWETRKQYIKSWWKPGLRGAVWLDQMVTKEDNFFPLFLAQDITLGNSNFTEHQRLQTRMSRTILETFRLGLPDVHWFVHGDDDTVFVVDNLVKLLATYDHTKFHYIGGISETHGQNTGNPCCSTSMAYGGAGYAISSALILAINSTLDNCIMRHWHLYGGDARIHACLLEVGVPLKAQPGLHQLDVRGDISGLLGAHPAAPLLSLHHIDSINPLFPTMDRNSSLNHFFKAVYVDSTGIVQQSLCYDTERKWSIQVSWGYLVQVTPTMVPLRELELPLRTFSSYSSNQGDDAFSFKSRSIPTNECEKPVTFYMESVHKMDKLSSVSNYSRHPTSDACITPLHNITWISIRKEATDDGSWYQAPRRQCCRILSALDDVIELNVKHCL